MNEEHARRRFCWIWMFDYNTEYEPLPSIVTWLNELWNSMDDEQKKPYYHSPLPFPNDGEYGVIDGGPSKSRKVGEGWIPSPMFRLPGPQWHHSQESLPTTLIKRSRSRLTLLSHQCEKFILGPSPLAAATHISRTTMHPYTHNPQRIPTWCHIARCCCSDIGDSGFIKMITMTGAIIRTIKNTPVDNRYDRGNNKNN